MKTMMQVLLIPITVILFSSTCWSQGGDAAVQPIGGKERTLLFPTRDMIDFGKAAAEANCFSCHGADGISHEDGKPHLAGQRTVYLYRVLKAFRSGGRKDEANNHNDFLNDKALFSTAIYYSSLRPVRIDESEEPAGTLDSEGLPVDTDDPFLAVREPMRKCKKCHGITGNSTRSGMANLTAQSPEYFMKSMQSYIDGSRTHKLMGKLVKKLDQEAIKTMALFYGVQEPEQTETLGEGDVNVGKRLSEHCEKCHGYDGNAEKAKMPSLAGQDAKYFIKALTHYKDGKRQYKKMFDAVELLSEQDIIDLASYYASQEPRKREGVRAPLRSSEWIARCERCHGIDGNSSDPRFPMLAGQDVNYLRGALKAYASGVRNVSTMHAMADPLSAMDIERISTYFSSQSPKSVVFLQLPCGDEKQQ